MPTEDKNHSEITHSPMAHNAAYAFQGLANATRSHVTNFVKNSADSLQKNKKLHLREVKFGFGARLIHSGAGAAPMFVANNTEGSTMERACKTAAVDVVLGTPLSIYARHPVLRPQDGLLAGCRRTLPLAYMRSVPFWYTSIKPQTQEERFKQSCVLGLATAPLNTFVNRVMMHEGEGGVEATKNAARHIMKNPKSFARAIGVGLAIQPVSTSVSTYINAPDTHKQLAQTADKVIKKFSSTTR